MKTLIATRLHRPFHKDTQLVVSLAVFILLVVYLWLGPHRGISFEQVSGGSGYWQLWLATLAHADVGHLFANLLFFTIFGALLFGHFGWLAFPILPLMMGGVVHYLTLAKMDAQHFLVGASGMVYFMGGFWLMLQALVGREKPRRLRLIRYLGFSLLLFAPSQAFEAQVSYLAHFIGFALGTPLGLIYFKLYENQITRDDVYVEVFDDETGAIDGTSSAGG